MLRLIKIGLITLLIAATPLAGYLWYYHSLSTRAMEQLQLDGEKANALKHALAAAELYQTLSYVLSDADAEKTVLWFGRMNEYAEQWAHAYPKDPSPGFQPDTTIEIIKDFHNNQVGVAAARWQATHMPNAFPTIDMIVRLLDTDVMIVWAPNLNISQTTLDAHRNDVAFSYDWVEQRRTTIIDRTENALEKLY